MPLPFPVLLGCDVSHLPRYCRSRAANVSMAGWIRPLTSMASWGVHTTPLEGGGIAAPKASENTRENEKRKTTAGHSTTPSPVPPSSPPFRVSSFQVLQSLPRDMAQVRVESVSILHTAKL